MHVLIQEYCVIPDPRILAPLPPFEEVFDTTKPPFNDPERYSYSKITEYNLQNSTPYQYGLDKFQPKFCLRNIPSNGDQDEV